MRKITWTFILSFCCIAAISAQDINSTQQSNAAEIQAAASHRLAPTSVNMEKVNQVVNQIRNLGAVATSINQVIPADLNSMERKAIQHIINKRASK